VLGGALMSAVYVGVLLLLRVRELRTLAAPLLRLAGRR
jgi:hypothetical protein